MSFRMDGTSGVGLIDGARVALVFAGLSVVSGVVRFVRQRSGADDLASLRVRRRVSVAKFVLSQTLVVVALVAYYRVGGWTFESVGVSRRASPLVAFLTGLGEFGLFTLLTQWVFAYLGAPFTYLQSALRANALLSPLGRARRCVMTGFATLVNPVAEELMFRGLLVHQLVVVGAPVWLAVGVGALVNTTNHAYQGRLGVVFHLAFYASSVALLFSPIGLFGAIGFHFGGDLLPVIQYRAQLRYYREARRAERVQRAAPETSHGAR